MNQINVISPYRWNGMWVFDDESKDLDKEPFVAGADTLLSYLTGGEAETCIIIFSKDEFPDYDLVVNKVKEGVGGGTDYFFESDDGYTHDLWLCPALLKYFEDAPEKIYFKIKDS